MKLDLISMTLTLALLVNGTIESENLVTDAKLVPLVGLVLSEQTL